MSEPTPPLANMPLPTRPVWCMPLAVSVAEAARMVDLDQTTIRAAIAARELPAKKHGRRILVPVAGLNEWLTNLPDASPE